jgi:spore coat-associated protein N
MIFNRMRGVLAPGRGRLVAAAVTAAGLSAVTAIAVPHTLGFFDASTTNPSNSFTAGTLQMTNSKNGLAIVTGTNMRPGDVKPGSVTITNSGSLSATMTLSESTIVPGAGTPTFAHDLQLVVVDTSIAGTPTVYSGAFDSMGTITLNPLTGTGQWAAAEAHTFSFTVTFPNAATSSDNQYQGTSASAEFDWHGVS